MADITSKATVELVINGKSADETIKDLKNKVVDLRKKMEECRLKNDTKGMTRYAKQIERTEKELKRVTAVGKDFSNTLKNLDKASLKNLQSTLKQLNRQISGLDQGTEEWNRQAAAIRNVRARIDGIRSSLRATHAETKTFWQHMKEWQTAAVGLFAYVAGKISGFISLSRESAEEFAAMQQEMANVRKYTGMSEKEVTSLNEAFKQMDTRTAREELNKYAQEAGRLGKTSEADVLGYVRAADKINVALDDLGEGATLTLSKLTGIFGDEKRLGTEKALLSVGSVINELSQNCSASAPYLAEFASRMGGVGAQAGMSVQQIMAFGAVLDANNINVEAASTALQQLMVRLYQSPAEYAKVAGIEVDHFKKLVSEDMNAAIIELLETLQQAGKMDVLAQVFKDMGEKGSNSVKLLSTLAGHIGEVRQQQEAANKAFSEATSIDKEFEVQNGTVQAALDKTRKEMTELRVELGQKLMPVVKLANGSGLLAMKMINSMISFVVNYRSVIFSLTAAFAGYTVAVHAATVKKQALMAFEKSGMFLKKTYKAIILNLAYAKAVLTGNTTRAAAATRLLNGAMLANPIGLVTAALAGLVTWLLILQRKTNECTKAIEEASNTAVTFADTLHKEKTDLDKLFGALDACKKGTEDYDKAKNAIISKYGTYLTGLINEKGEILNLAEAYNRLSWAAERSSRARGIADAKGGVNSAYFNGINDLAVKLETNLAKLGVDQRKITEITTKVSTFFGKEGDLKSDEWKNIWRMVATATNEKSNSFSYMWSQDSNPLYTLGQMRDALKLKNSKMKHLDIMENRNFKGVSQDDLSGIINSLSEQLARTPQEKIDVSITVGNKQNAQKLANAITSGTNAKTSGTSFKIDTKGVMNGVISRKQADNLLKELLFEQAQRGGGSELSPESETSVPPSAPYTSSKQADKDAKKAEAAARRAEIKARKEFKEELNNAKGEWELGDAKNIAQRTQGIISWTEFLEEKHRLQEKFYDDQLKIFENHNLQEDEDYQELLKKKEQLNADWLNRKAAMEVEDAKNRQKAEELQAQFDFDSPESPVFRNEEARQIRLHDIKIKYLKKMRDAYQKDSKEYYDYNLQITEAEETEKLRLKKQYADLYVKYSKQYEMKSAKELYDYQAKLIEKLKELGFLTEQQFEEAMKKLKEETIKNKLPDSAKKPETEDSADLKQKQKELNKIESLYAAGLMTEEEYLKAKDRIEEYYAKRARDRARNTGNEYSNMALDLFEAFKAFSEDNGQNIFQKIGKAAQATFAVMSAAMQMYSDFMKAETDLIVANIEKRYDREAALAEGNVYLQKQAEKKKQKEIAKAKNEENRKMYAMQIIQAVAQTAMNALQAYGAMVGIPVVGPTLAAVAAAMATAAGLVQIAAIRKQKQASEAQGYMLGGFTPKGRRDEPVGVVHAGEWVAPQELVNSPQTRPIINLLEHARRNNRVASIRPADVAAASMPVISAKAIRPEVVINNVPQQQRDDSELRDTISRLSDRLDEPFVTVNSVTGPYGIKRALDQYDRLTRNKSPK